MRNWNVGIELERSGGYSFQTTYEELKRISNLLKLSMVGLPDYLWGIETDKPNRSGGSSTASRLPMRNWNFFSNERRDGNDALPDYLWGIETSSSDSASSRWSSASRLPMRNWNPPFVWNCGIVWNGFQTTYEELKRSKVSEVSTLEYASRLPMRNWNLRAGQENFAVRMLPDYLWGIETVWIRPQWTHTQLRFQTTYEELKPPMSTTSGCEPWLPDYLWGIETSSNTNYQFRERGFQTTYEELKLSDDLEKMEPNVLASRLPMRNWNIFV